MNLIEQLTQDKENTKKVIESWKKNDINEILSTELTNE